MTLRDECFCWCFWSFAVPVATLADAASIQVRGMDEANTAQPKDMYWNAMSMMKCVISSCSLPQPLPHRTLV